MKIKYYIIGISLLLSLFVYVFYRTEQTLVNYLCIQMVGGDMFSLSRIWMHKHITLSAFQRYSLPEALWILSITLLSKRYVIKWGRFTFSLLYLPLILAFGFECFQFLGWSPGQADINDLVGGILFWIIGVLLFPERDPKISLFKNMNIHSLLCTGTYAVVYLAHVIKG